MSGKALVLQYTQQRVERDEMLPDPGLLITASGIVVLAVVLWAVVSLVQGRQIRPLEAVMFALVFTVVYFGGLSVFNDNANEESS